MCHFLHPNDFQFAGFLKAGVPARSNNGACGGGGLGGRQPPWCFLNLIFSDFHPLTSAFNLAVALKAGFALADVLSGQVAALRVLHTFPGQLGDLALVNI